MLSQAVLTRDQLFNHQHAPLCKTTGGQTSQYYTYMVRLGLGLRMDCSFFNPLTKGQTTCLKHVICETLSWLAHKSGFEKFPDISLTYLCSNFNFP